MKCGFYELDITPSLGSIIPGSFGARYSDEILDPLYVRAIAVKNDEKTLAIVSVDACGITADITEKIRNRVSSLVPVLPEDVMVMATHAHGGGPTLTWGEQVVRDEEYIKNLVNKASDAICMAYKKAEDSEIYTGSGELFGVSFIRVYRLKGDRLKTNPGDDLLNDIIEPCSTIDPEVGVLAVKQEGEYKGAVINFADHPAIVADNRISGDYISALSAEMKRIYGPQFVTVFINGACGNINHINPFDPETRLPGRHIVVGKKIAEAAEKIIENAVRMDDNKLSSVSKSIKVKFRKPTKEQLISAKEVFDSLGDGLIDSIPRTPGYRDTFFALQTFLIMADKRTQSEVALQVLKIGSCYVFGTPAQLFVEFGKKMKAACDGLAFVSAFANDYQGYVPTPECMKEGVYEATLAKTSALEAAAGDKIADAVIDMYNRIK